MDYLNRVIARLESYAYLGQRKLDNGTLLIGHVPHVAPEAWLHAVYAPLEKQDIHLIEQFINSPIPTVLRDFYLRCNGLSLFSYSLTFDGLRRSFERTGDSVWQPFSIKTPNVDERPKFSKPYFVFIGGYKWDGSLLYIDSSNDRVFRCRRRSAKPLNEWENFESMLELEVQRLSCLFDRQGRIIDSAKPTTP